MKNSIFNLLQSHKIKIPIIQRDYAQGRPKAEELRNNFIIKLREVLESKDALNLDFIYGYEQKEQNDLTFIPIDGQQRLTTLWLILWYFACKEGYLNKNQTDNESEKISSALRNFTYETRISSKRFCENLVKNPVTDIDSVKNISEEIVDAAWFMATWEYDPTVKAVLNMLNTIHEEMKGCSPGMFNRLTEDNCITFEYINIKAEEFKLTDELYIKMNSRGKPLTTFENFKAQLSDLLSEKNTDFYNEKLLFEDSEVSYLQYFAFKVDGKWMDLFWDYRKRKVVPDEALITFFNFVSEMLFYRQQPRDKENRVEFDKSFNQLKPIYRKKENVDFLINSLDLLVNYADLDKAFGEIFSCEVYKTSKIELFDSSGTNLFFQLISGESLDVRKRVLLYSILKYGSKVGTEADKSRIEDFLRIVRNILWNVKQVNTSKRIEYISNLRLPNFNDYSKFVDNFVQLASEHPNQSIYYILLNNEFTGFPQDLINIERRKASLIVNNLDLKDSLIQLENHPQIQGYIDNFQLESKDLLEKIWVFKDIWNENIPNSLRTGAFLTFGDYSVVTHSNCYLGPIKYFGSLNYWNRILSTGDKEEKTSVTTKLDKFLSGYIGQEGTTTVEKLKGLIKKFDVQKDNWKYYFLEYPSILASGLNLFTWNGNGFNLNKVHSAGKQPLNSYHENAYLIALRKSIEGCSAKTSIMLGRYSYEMSHIIIDSKIKIYSEESGFSVHPINSFHFSEETINKFQLLEKTNYYFLREFDRRDRIKLASDLIDTLVLKAERVGIT